MLFKNTQQKRKPVGKGFYIALGICLVAVGAASWMTYNSVVDFMEPMDSQIGDPSKNGITPPKDYEKEAGNTLSGVKDQPKNSSEETTQTNSAEKPKDTLVIYPVSSNIIKGYSDNNPVYSKTLSDWRVHNAIDFAAEQGSTVKAMSSGEVRDIYNDPVLGMTVAIDHDGSYTVYYCGLGDTVLVEKGQKVSTGDDIGSINDIPSEISDGFHLHLAIKQGDNWIDPMSILKDAKS